MVMIKRLGILLSLLWLCFSPLTQAAKSDDDTGSDDKQVYTIDEDTELVSTLKISYDKPSIVVKSIYPRLISYAPNQAVDDFNDLVKEFIRDQIKEYKTRLEQRADELNNEPKKTLNNLYIDYSASIIKSDGNPILSIRFNVQGSLAAIGYRYHYHRVLNYDLNTGEKITLSDLFQPGANYLAAFANYTSNDLLRDLRNRELVMDGTAPQAENFINWNIKPQGILITFDAGQVAPPINGAYMVLVPYAELKRIMSENAVIEECVRHSKKCERSNLLVGGFIDT